MNYPLTLLSPARDYEVGVSAIQAGADAVYIGAPKFGARQAAGNSRDDIARLVEYARPYGVAILVTLNTLLHENERTEALQIADDLWQTGIEAFIVQDLWLMEQLIARDYRVHASTQCDNRSIEQVQRMRDMGCQRVVLARELSIDQIRAIHEAVPDIELEVFVHGALCVSYSGCCYMSEVLCGRSANRGACAQYCRMRYDLLDSAGNEVLDDNGKPIHQRYLLSLQDLDRSMLLSQLIEAGATTFKIEGRLKDSSYVTNVVAYYNERLNHLTAGGQGTRASLPSICTYDFTPNPEKTFHRGGIDYFTHGRTPHMANFETPKSTGERITADTILHNGDGICFGDQGFSVNGIRPNGEIIPNKPVHIPPGTTLYRNYDSEFEKHLHTSRRIPADILFEETETGFRLTIGPHSRDFDYPHEPARNAERTLLTIREQISKLGESIYVPSHIEVRTQPYFIPISILNEWRRLTLQ